MYTKQRTRAGFTLVELLVAVALTMVIMGIIAVAFQKSIDTFRLLHSVGQMQERLKSAEIVLKRDLGAEHFGGNFKPGFSGPYVRDQRLDLVGWLPPDEGFFAIIHGNANQVQGSDNSISEGPDSDGLYSFRAVNHTLHFTVKLSGKREEDYFYAWAPTNIANASPADFKRPSSDPNNALFASRWAEVCYFLVPLPTSSANGQPLYTLYRRQRVAAPTGGANLIFPPTQPAQNYPDVSSVAINANTSIVNTSAALTRQQNRMLLSGINASEGGGSIWKPLYIGEGQANPPPQMGDDILLTDVLSFEAKVFWSNGPAGPQQQLTFPSAATPDWPFAVLPVSPINLKYGGVQNNGERRFDTWSRQDANAGINWDDPQSFNTVGNDKPPLRIRVSTLQIRIRVWDSNAQQARQLTMVQDI